MADTTTGLMTVEEYCRLPEESGEFYYELHHGELVVFVYQPERPLKSASRRFRWTNGTVSATVDLDETDWPAPWRQAD
jgi:hypothetical protein